MTLSAVPQNKPFQAHVIKKHSKRAAKTGLTVGTAVAIISALLVRYIPAWHNGLPSYAQEILPALVAMAGGYLGHIWWIRRIVRIYEQD